MDTTSAGYSYFGLVTTANEAHAIIEACRSGVLPRVTRRLTDQERLIYVRAGAVFVWDEDEAGIRRWTDHIKWSPSRVSGPFLTYSEVPGSGEETLIKQSFSSAEPGGAKMHLLCYTSKAAVNSQAYPIPSRDPLLQPYLSNTESKESSTSATPISHKTPNQFTWPATSPPPHLSFPSQAAPPPHVQQNVSGSYENYDNTMRLSTRHEPLEVNPDVSLGSFQERLQYSPHLYNYHYPDQASHLDQGTRDRQSSWPYAQSLPQSPVVGNPVYPAWADHKTYSPGWQPMEMRGSYVLAPSHEIPSRPQKQLDTPPVNVQYLQYPETDQQIHAHPSAVSYTDSTARHRHPSGEYQENVSEFQGSDDPRRQTEDERQLRLLGRGI